MTPTTKRIALLFLIGTLIPLILLAASLSNLELHAGAPFPGAGNSEAGSQSFPDFPSAGASSLPILKGIFALVLLILMIYVPARLIVLVNVKRVLQWIAALVVLFFIVLSIPTVAPGRPGNLLEESSIPTDSPAFEYPTSPLGRPPQELIWLVMIGFVLGAGWVAINRSRRRLSPTRVKDQLSREAESAVRAIKAGNDPGGVIIRCYLQMTHALQEEQAIQRSDNMTVQEFEAALDLKGFPSVPVHQLTSLFEKVRYGKQQMREGDEKTAVQSLDEIIRFCRNERK